MGLDFNHTCSVINSNIAYAKQSIENNLDNLLDEVCPMLDGPTRRRFLDEQVNVMYETFGEYFENIRSTNEDMRSTADKQIDDLENKVSELEEEVEYLRRKLEETEEKVEELQYQITTTW